MTTPLETLIDILTLDRIDDDTWRGQGSTGDGADATFGGHFLGQATAAAYASAEEERILHSLHAYFLRGGTPEQPIDYRVTTVRDGRAFSHRRVSAMQNDKLLFEMIASLTTPEHGKVIAPPPPADFDRLPDPEALPRFHEMMASLDPLPLPAAWALREHGVDMRTINAPWVAAGPSPEGGIRNWIRANGTMPADPQLATAILAYQSDESISDNCLIPFGLTWGSPGITFVSLDHAMWFHRPADLNEWHLVEQRPETAAAARGLSTGRIWNRQGELVASFTQEALMRLDDAAD